jgi:hypothetical protein
MFGAFISINSHARAVGIWRDDHARPLRYTSWGLFRGDERHVDISYPAGDPLVQVLVPAQDTDHEPVPESLRHGSIDGISMIADLVREVSKRGSCDGQVRIFDGRRAALVTAHDAGVDVLPHESRSIFEGPALRCDFETQVLAGLPRDAGPDDSARRPQKGSIWLAHVLPGRPMLPVLLSVETRIVGHVNVYLTQAGTQVDFAEFTPRAP